MNRSPLMTTTGDGGLHAILADMKIAPNAVYFVQSTHANAGDTAGRGLTPDAPFATINYAITLCTASKGDLIIVLPGHVETVVGAAGVALNIAGVSIVGVGEAHLRPKINFTTSTAASFDITAAKCRVENIWFNCGIDSQTAMVNIAAADVTIRNCEFMHGDATNQAVIGILTTSSADRLMIDSCFFHGSSDAGTNNAISLVGGDGIIIKDNVITGAYHASAGIIKGTTTDSTNLQILRNFIVSQTASTSKCIVLTASSTGMIANNRMQVTSGSTPITGAAMAWVGNTTGTTIATEGGITVSLSAVTDQLSNGGVATWPSAAAYGNNKDLAAVLAYIQDGVRKGSGTAMGTNKSIADALGTDGVTLTDAAVNLVGIIGSNLGTGSTNFASTSVGADRDGNLMERNEDVIDQAERCVITGSTTPSGSAVTIFTVAGGPVELLSLGAVCVTANDSTAATLKFSVDPTGAITSTDLGTGASGSTANAPANSTIVAHHGDATAATYSATVGVGTAGGTNAIVTAGVITYTVGSGPMTGTWKFWCRYRPLAPGTTVAAAF